MFTCLDYDNDEDLPDNIICHTKKPNTRHATVVHSLKHATKYDWKEENRASIRKIDLAIAIREHADIANSATAESFTTYEEKRPRFLLRGCYGKVCKEILYSTGKGRDLQADSEELGQGDWRLVAVV